MSTPEFSRPINARQLPADPLHLTASESERRALSQRFRLVSIHSLEARLELAPDGDAVRATGTLSAHIVQSCAISGDDLPAHINEQLSLRFVAQAGIVEEEIELDADDCDDIAFEGDMFDLGEAVAQGLALAIDPYAVGPNADRVREEGLLGESAGGAFAALAALKKK